MIDGGSEWRAPTAERVTDAAAADSGPEPIFPLLGLAEDSRRCPPDAWNAEKREKKEELFLPFSLE